MKKTKESDERMDLRAVDVDEWDANDDYKDHVCDIA